MSAIVALLNEYSSKVKTVDGVTAEIQKVAGDLIAQKVKLEAELKALKDTIKDKAKFIPDSQAHTLRGSAHQLVWVNGSESWDESKIAALIEKYNTLSGETVTAASLKTAGEPGWALRVCGKK